MTGSRPVPRTPPSVTPAAADIALSPALDRVRREVETGNLPLDGFWAGLGSSSPVIEPDPHDPGHRIVTFLWRDADSASVILEVNKVTTGPHHGAMERIPHTDIWHRTLRLDARWRGGYGFAPLDAAGLAALDSAAEQKDPRDRRAAARALRARMRPDPRNPLSETGPGGAQTSVAELDLAPAQPWLAGPGRPAPDPSPCVGPGGRTLWEWTPDADATDGPSGGNDGSTPSPQPLVLILDGAMWRERGHLSATVTALIGPGLIRPPVVVWVDNGVGPDRVADLSVDSDTARWLASELIPWLRGRHPISPDPRDVIVVGQSLGGLTALKTALDHPDAVGTALAQSSSLWQDDMLDRARAADPDRTRVWLEVGTNEPVLLEPHRQLQAALAARGIPHAYREYVGGHDPVCWRGGIGDGLLDLLRPGRPEVSTRS